RAAHRQLRVRAHPPQGVRRPVGRGGAGGDRSPGGTEGRGGVALARGLSEVRPARIRGMGGSMAMTAQGDGPRVAMRCMGQRSLDAVRFWPLLIPFLLVGMLAQPSFAEHPQPGWIADAQSGCRIWNPRPEPYDGVTWPGACQNALAQGRGVEQWFKNGQPSNRYEGEFLDGKEN